MRLALAREVDALAPACVDGASVSTEAGAGAAGLVVVFRRCAALGRRDFFFAMRL